MKRIALIGSTGSIGCQVLNVVRAYFDRFKIVAMSAHSQYSLFEKQINEFKPEVAALSDPLACQRVANIPQGTRFLRGDDAYDVASFPTADIVIVAASGFAGLKYSLRALEAGKVLALANKETLVCGGDLVRRYKDSVIIPIDSEHSAIWQCINFERNAQLKNLIITASGGAFRGKKQSQLDWVTPEQALAHPTWNMGKKITIDSATMLNKGFEVIEAHHLYSIGYENIKTVIHPQSIVHSMVEFDDGAILAQLSHPTMEVPIQLALTYPERLPSSVKQMDFANAFSLEFSPLVRVDYPCFDLALSAGEAGGIMPCVLNASSEYADYAFLDGRITYTQIAKVIEEILSSTRYEDVESYLQLEEIDAMARRKAQKIIEKIGR